MNGSRAAFGLCLLCALIIGAVAAQSAMATGTTAFTCKKVVPKAGTAGFSKSHCKQEDEVGTEAAYEHFAIEQGKTTEATGSNEGVGTETTGTSTWSLSAVVSGISLIITAEGLHGEGTLLNILDVSGEHYVQGEGTATFTKVKVAQPAGRNCEVFTDKGGAAGAVEVVHTTSLKATTKGLGHTVKFEPAAGNVLATFIIQNCKVPPFSSLNGTYAVTGSVVGTADGATVSFNHMEITGLETLHVKGTAVAGIEGTVTFSGRTDGTEAFTPFSPTTAETP